MITKKLFGTTLYFLIGSLFIVTMMSCSDSGGDSGGTIELIPLGLRIKQGSQVIVEQNAAGTVTGSLSVTSSDQGPTESIKFDLVYLGAGGIEFTPEPEEHTLEFNSSSSVLSFTNIDSDGDPFSFEVDNDGTGAGTFTITLLKGEEVQFLSTALPFEVVNSTNKLKNID